MKFTISKEDLLDGLQKVQHVVSSRMTLPILSNVLLEAQDDQLRLTATDLNVVIQVVVRAQVSRSGSSTLPVKRLVNIVSALPASEIDISVDAKNVATIKCARSLFKINGLSGGEFPEQPELNEPKEYRISQKTLRDGLKKTSYAISADETRYVLNGIYMSFQDGKMTLVATDGRRLAMVENDLEFPAGQEAAVIIPTKAVQELLQRHLGDQDDVLVRLDEKQISFSLGRDDQKSLLISKLIEGNYPNYRQVIPEDPNIRVELPRKETLEIVSRVALLTSERTSSVKLVLSDNQMEVLVNSPDVGEAYESLDIEYSHEKIQIAFNPDFLKAPLQNLEEPTVYLDLIDEMSPGVFRLDSDFLYVIMPMRVSN